jgi:ABC-type glycerol-3-phosphate transport system permease component
MKKELVYCLLMTIVFNIILFPLCALPWYGVITISGWYLLLALPLTVLGCSTCIWINQDLWDVFTKEWDDYFDKD